jgi:hypothetical protein
MENVGGWFGLFFAICWCFGVCLFEVLLSLNIGFGSLVHGDGAFWMLVFAFLAFVWCVIFAGWFLKYVGNRKALDLSVLRRILSSSENENETVAGLFQIIGMVPKASFTSSFKPSFPETNTVLANEQ